MSFIIQEIPQPTIFGIATQTTAGAGGTITFELGTQDELFFEGFASSNFDVNVIFDPTTSLDVAMQDGDVANASLKITTGVSAVSLTSIKIDGTVVGNTYSFGTPWSATPLLISAGGITDISLEIVKINTNIFQVFAKKENYTYIGGVPSIPGLPSASVVNGTTVLVNFAAASGGAYGVDSYTVISSPSAITATSATPPITVSGLTENTPYTFDVYATNEIGSGPTAGPSNQVTPQTPAGQQLFDTVGTFSWVAPVGVNSVSVVAVGGGGGGFDNAGSGGGGGLGYKNNFSVTPGNSYTVVVGAAGARNGNGGQSYFNSAATVAGNGGTYNTGGTKVGDGGGNGGGGSNGGGGGGAGGYSGNGGTGQPPGACVAVNANGAGGGGAGGFANQSSDTWYRGGGVWYLGEGASGVGVCSDGEGQRGSFTPTTGSSLYGGGGGKFANDVGWAAERGFVRIIWAGSSGITRAFPSTNTGDL